MYDITHPRTLQITARLLQQYGYERINYSVWLGQWNPLKNPELNEKLNVLLNDKIAEGSLLYVVPVSRKDLNKTRNINGKKPRQLDYWTGEERSIFF